MQETVELSKPKTDLVSSYLEFIDEMQKLGEKIWQRSIPTPGESTKMFVSRLIKAELISEAGFFPETTYWATIHEKVVVRIALRHTLNETLSEFGGHIGYEVRPSFRSKGIAKEMLRKVLLTSKAREIGNLLLTCSPDNIASNKTILANGGNLFKTAFVEKIQRNTNYYWINL